jgi:hypothetical protein
MWGKGYVIASAGACTVLVGNFAYIMNHDGNLHYVLDAGLIKPGAV